MSALVLIAMLDIALLILAAFGAFATDRRHGMWLSSRGG